MTNNQNLIPFAKGPDPRRQNGRKPGSKNIATLVKEMLDADLDSIPNSEIKKLLQNSNSKNAKEAIISALIIKTIKKSDPRTAELLFRYTEYTENPANKSVLDDGKIEITIVESTLKQREQKALLEAERQEREKLDRI